jgi:hypothetical protein
MAKYLERHIISLNLKYVKKGKLTKILLEPEVNFVIKKTKDVIFVLEEFDQVIKYLIDKKKIYDNKMDSLATSNKEQDIMTTIEKNNNEIYLGDLLEIFQSSIPREGQIIIATSNNFEDMQKELPALFRPGRLTPIYLSYIDQSVLNDIVKYYFPTIKSNRCTLPSNHKIPTSQIIEFAKLSNGNYSMFCKLMTEIMYK